MTHPDEEQQVSETLYAKLWKNVQTVVFAIQDDYDAEIVKRDQRIAGLERQLESARTAQIKRGDVLATSGAEHRWIEDQELACDYCGGSGHKDDMQAQSVKVKPLVWHGEYGDVADTPWGKYCVSERSNDLFWWSHTSRGDWDESDEGFDSEKIAKAAAQADYEQRILSALDVSDGD